MFIYGKPSDEERERDYDSFEVMGRRMDVFSFSTPGYPFNATSLGHYWTNDKELEDQQVITRLRPYFCLVSYGFNDNQFLKHRGLFPIMEVRQQNINEYIDRGDDFARGDLSAESGLRERMLSSDKKDEWVAQLSRIRRASFLSRSLNLRAEAIAKPSR